MNKFENYNNVLECESFFDYINNINEQYGDLIAFNSGEKTWTYKEVCHIVMKNASNLEGTGKIYCLNVKDPVNFFVIFMAITISGNIAWLSPQVPSDDDYIYISDIKVNELMDTENCGEFVNRYKKDQISVIVRSSGTTSIAKEVMLTQTNILSDTIAGMRLYDYPKEAVYFKVLPYYHLFGLVADLLGPLYSGGTICFSNDDLNFFKNMNRFKPTHMNLPPAIVSIIEKMLISSSCVSEVTGGRLKKIMCAGAAISTDICTNLKKYGISVFPAYGLTECSPCVSMNCDMYNKAGSVGVVLPGVDIAIQDDEICVRGDIVMKGYWKDKSATNRVLKNKWLMTGDLGYIDEDGFLFLTGRKTNLIVFEDGTKLSPEILESNIISLSEVEECIVYPLIQNSKTVLNVKLFSRSKEIELIKNKIKQSFIKIGIIQRLNEIEFSKGELKKNELGKILRK